MNPDQVGFAVQPRRWVVERFFAWIGRNRRLAKDFEATIGADAILALARKLRRLRSGSIVGSGPDVDGGAVPARRELDLAASGKSLEAGITAGCATKIVTENELMDRGSAK